MISSVPFISLLLGAWTIFIVSNSFFSSIPTKGKLSSEIGFGTQTAFGDHSKRSGVDTIILSAKFKYIQNSLRYLMSDPWWWIITFLFSIFQIGISNPKGKSEEKWKWKILYLYEIFNIWNIFSIDVKIIRIYLNDLKKAGSLVG